MPHICHGGGVFQFCRNVCSNTNLDGARPLGYHLVQPHFKQLIRFQRAVRQNHAIIEVIHCTTHTELHRTLKPHLFDNANNIWQKRKIIKLLIMYFSPVPCHFICLRPTVLFNHNICFHANPLPQDLKTTCTPINLNALQIVITVLRLSTLNTALDFLGPEACLGAAIQSSHSLGTVSSAAVVDDGGMGATVGMEHKPVHKVLLWQICQQDTKQ